MSMWSRMERAMVKVTARFVARLRCHADYFGRWRQYFDFWEAVGLHLLPVHYLSPVPDTRELPSRLWSEKLLHGIDIGYGHALELLQEFESQYSSEYRSLAEPNAFGGFCFGNGAFDAGDAEMLYCMVRRHRPRRVIEVGSGYTTLVTARALEQNRRDGHFCDFVAIEPYPKPALRERIAAVATLLEKKVQEVEAEVFTELESGDILFLDSTHVVRIGSDVCYEFLEILPRLKPGVLVHVHDIFLPCEYPQEWVYECRFFWTEQYLLQAFLTFNREFSILWPGHAMQLRYPERMAAAFPRCQKDTRPSSFWMRRRTNEGEASQ